jgi:hypothetical protein
MKDRVLTIIAASFMAIASVATTATASTLTIVTDTTWEVSPDGINWNGTFATASFPFGTNPGIWDSTPGQTGESLFFRKTFTIPGTFNSAQLKGGADDNLVSFKINGNLIFGETNGSAGPELFANPLLAVFLPGVNTIIANASNIGGPSTFGATLTIDYTPAPVPVPAALPLFATGLGVLAFLARRRTRKNAAALVAA